MWTCPICKNRNADTLTLCWMCGALPGDKEEPTMLTAEDLLPADRPIRPLPKASGVTRRFSVGTMMILMTFYALLFSGLKVIGAGSPIFIGVAVFFTGVGVGQMFLYQSRDPRKASFLAGLIMGVVSGILMIALAEIMPAEKDSDFVLVGTRFIGGVFCLWGCPLGYLAGGLIASIFLFREREEQATEDEEEEIKSHQ